MPPGSEGPIGDPSDGAAGHVEHGHAGGSGFRQGELDRELAPDRILEDLERRSRGRARIAGRFSRRSSFQSPSAL